MRGLFLFVLLLNIAYVAWQTSVPAKDSYANVSALHDVEPIILIRELGDDEQDESVSVVETLALGVVEVESDSEVGDVSVVDAEERCFTLGPFRDKDKLQNLKKEIKSYVVKTAIRVRDEKEDSVHWVYIQPEKNRRSAIELGKRLKSKKIKDFYIIREGEKNNGISLGHFKDISRAFGLESKVKKLGFNVQVEPMYKTYEVFWLDYQLLGDDIPEAIVGEYIQSVNEAKVTRLSRDCGA